MHTAKGETYNEACYCSKTFDRDLHILLVEKSTERERERDDSMHTAEGETYNGTCSL